MATKTIPQLNSASSVDVNALFPIDSGTETFKITFGNILKSIYNVTFGQRVSADTTIVSNNRYVFVSGTTTVTLPASASVIGQEFTIKNVDGSGNTVTIAFNGSESADGKTTLTLPERYQFIKLFANGTGFDIVGW